MSGTSCLLHLFRVEPPTAQSLARLDRCRSASPVVLNDALGQPAFHRWLLDPATVTPNKEGGTGQVTWRPGPGYSAARSRLGEVSSRVSGAEQSNSAVIFGTELLAKVFRKLRPGLNPDIEISRVLSTQSEFQSFPELLGDLSFDTSDGQNYSIGMMLPFIPNYGDAWAYTLSILRDMLLGGTGAHRRAIPPPRCAHRRATPGPSYAHRRLRICRRTGIGRRY